MCGQLRGADLVGYALCLSCEEGVLRARQGESTEGICPDVCVWCMDIAERNCVCWLVEVNEDRGGLMAQTGCQVELPLVAIMSG